MVTDRQSVSVDISVIAGLFMNLVMQKVGKLRLQLALVAFGVALYIKPFFTTCLKKTTFACRGSLIFKTFAVMILFCVFAFSIYGLF